MAPTGPRYGTTPRRTTVIRARLTGSSSSTSTLWTTIRTWSRQNNVRRSTGTTVHRGTTMPARAASSGRSKRLSSDYTGTKNWASTKSSSGQLPAMLMNSTGRWTSCPNTCSRRSPDSGGPGQISFHRRTVECQRFVSTSSGRALLPWFDNNLPDRLALLEHP